MKLECAREQDILDAAAAGRWPARADAELRVHAAACPICRDVAEIAAAFLDDRELAWKEADVPPASVIWWRAQVRAREDASRTATRPIALAQGVAAVVLAACALLLVFYSIPWLGSIGEVVRGGFAWVVPRAADLAAAFELTAGRRIPLFALTATVLLAPIAVYLALADE